MAESTEMENTSNVDVQSPLTEKDIEGASLDGREPKQLTVEQLKFWLKCRNIKITKLKTKAELISKVITVDQSGQSTIIDPTQGQQWLNRKRKLTDGAGQTDPTNSSAGTVDIPLKLPTSGWTQDLTSLPDFPDINITTYLNKSGKTVKARKVISKPEKRGYQFFNEQYVHDYNIVLQGDTIFIKAKCHPSQRKNNPPHNLWCGVTRAYPHNVHSAYCSCVAGASGFCNHIFALLYQTNHYSKTETKSVPACYSKTSVPQVWDKPRCMGIQSEPVMQCTVQKAKATASKHVKCTLYEARTTSKIGNDVDVLKTTQETLRQKNALYGFSYMVNPDNASTDYVKTRLGSMAPLGSVLSYQLALTEGDYTVLCNDKTFHSFECKQKCLLDDVHPPLPIGDFPLPVYSQAIDIHKEISDYLNGITITLEDAHKQEIMTRDQSGSSDWWKARQDKFTASQFRDIYMKKPTTKWDAFVSQKMKTQVNSTKMPEALKHGHLMEPKAAEKYEQYMNNSGRKIKVHLSGFVVRPDLPYMGCSPDRKVVDELCHPHVGIVEIKCPYKYKGITPMEAAQINDPAFCLELKNGKLHLKETHAYYFQVQGQIALCGVKWCDFIVYTTKGMHIERIGFNDSIWALMHQKFEMLYITKFLPKFILMSTVK